jgi:hypothetical protein
LTNKKGISSTKKEAPRFSLSCVCVCVSYNINTIRARARAWSQEKKKREDLLIELKKINRKKTGKLNSFFG